MIPTISQQASCVKLLIIYMNISSNTVRFKPLLSRSLVHGSIQVMMVDPAVAFLQNQNYSTFDRGLAAGAYLKNPNGTVYKGLVWPGTTLSIPTEIRR